MMPKLALCFAVITCICSIVIVQARLKGVKGYLEALQLEQKLKDLQDSYPHIEDKVNGGDALVLNNENLLALKKHLQNLQDDRENSESNLLSTQKLLKLFKLSNQNRDADARNDRDLYRLNPYLNDYEEVDKDRVRYKKKLLNANSNNRYYQYRPSERVLSLLNKDLNDQQQGIEEDIQETGDGKQSLAPVRLLEYLNNGLYTNNKADNVDLSTYSKIYVVLNPEAVERSKNKKEIYELLTKILHVPPTSVNDKRYKNLLLKDNITARRKNTQFSRENTNGSDDEDFKPKKRNPENNFPRGSGRTAIPYVRSRNIYDRDTN